MLDYSLLDLIVAWGVTEVALAGVDESAVVDLAELTVFQFLCGREGNHKDSFSCPYVIPSF